MNPGLRQQFENLFQGNKLPDDLKPQSAEQIGVARSADVDLAEQLKNGGVAVIVGGRTTNFTDAMRRHPRLIFWDSTDPKSGGKDLPSNVRAVLITQFIGHSRDAFVRRQAKDRGAFCPPGLMTTGVIREALEKFLKAPSPTVHSVATVTTPTMPPMTAPPPSTPPKDEPPMLSQPTVTAPPTVKTLRPPRHGELADYVIAHANLSVSQIQDARRLFAELQSIGIKSTLGSVSESIRRLKPQIVLRQAQVKIAAAPVDPPITLPEDVFVPTYSAVLTKGRSASDLLLENITEAETYVSEMRQAATEMLTRADLLGDVLPKLRAEVERFRRQQKAIREVAQQAAEFLE